jgi:hypothetical protein
MCESERADPKVEFELWNDHIDDLLRIRLLNDSWDGHGSLSPVPALVDSAIYLAQMCQRNSTDPECRICSSSTGTIKFQWRLDDVFCEIEVIKPFEAIYSKILENGYSDAWEFSWTKDDVYAMRKGDDNG